MEVREYPVLAPAAGQALLSLQRSGVCGTDIHIVTGRLGLPAPLILGHEFVGRIAQLGSGAAVDGLGHSLAVGDTAIACVALPCGACFSCGHGHTASCMNFGVTYVADPAKAPHFFGGFAEYLHSPATSLVKVPVGLQLDAVAATPCAGPTVIRAFEYGGYPEPGELVVVQGTGPVGLFAIAWAAKTGCTVVAIGSSSSPQRLELAKALGASVVLDYRQTPPEERAKTVADLAARLGRGNGADLVVEGSGSPAAIPEGMNLLRTLGRYLIPGQYSMSGGAEIQPQLFAFKALRLIGSGQYTLRDIGTYLDFLARYPDVQTTLARTLTHRFTVADINAAMQTAEAGKSIKTVLVPA